MIKCSNNKVYCLKILLKMFFLFLRYVQIVVQDYNMYIFIQTVRYDIMSINIYIYMYIHILYIYIYAHIYTYILLYKPIIHSFVTFYWYMYIYIYAHTYIYIHIYVHIYKYLHIYIWIFTFTFLSILAKNCNLSPCAYIHIYIDTYLHRD
jgi:hypothetical protein